MVMERTGMPLKLTTEWNEVRLEDYRSFIEMTFWGGSYKNVHLASCEPPDHDDRRC